MYFFLIEGLQECMVGFTSQLMYTDIQKEELGDKIYHLDTASMIHSLLLALMVDPTMGSTDEVNSLNRLSSVNSAKSYE